jgi:hypothetical protein
MLFSPNQKNGGTGACSRFQTNNYQNNFYGDDTLNQEIFLLSSSVFAV